MNHICHDLFFSNPEASKYFKQNIFWVLINRDKITNGLSKEFCELWLQICFISQLDHLSKIIAKYCYKWRQLKKNVLGIPFLPIGIFSPQFLVSWKLSFETLKYHWLWYYLISYIIMIIIMILHRIISHCNLWK